MFFTESNVVHMGDQYVSQGFPFVDFSSGGDVDGYVATQQAVLARVFRRDLEGGVANLAPLRVVVDRIARYG